MPTMGQLKFRKTLVDEVRLLRRSKMLFGHTGYVRWRGDDACTVCILGGLVAAAMNRKGQYLPFIKDPVSTTDKVLGRRMVLVGWSYSAVMDLCGLSLLEVYTLEAVYERGTTTMSMHDMHDDEIDTVDELLQRIEVAWSPGKLTDDEMAEKILQVLEKSADHPTGDLRWFDKE